MIWNSPPFVLKKDKSDLDILRVSSQKEKGEHHFGPNCLSLEVRDVVTYLKKRWKNMKIKSG